MKKPAGIYFFVDFMRYLIWRSIQTYRWTIAVIQVIGDFFTHVKEQLLTRMFWGRGSLYKASFHYLVTFLSVGLVAFGVLQRASIAAASQALTADSTASNLDLFSQGGNLETVLELDPEQPNYQIKYHVVSMGETLESIADSYHITADTIRWANINQIGPFSNRLEPGWKLAIPEINGVLYTVKVGDTLESIAAKFRANLFQIREMNDLVPPTYAISLNQKLLIPDAQPIKYEGKVTTEMLANAFLDPLSHPNCTGYTYYGGFTATHNGVDLVASGGCTIRSIAAGEVWHAGWWGGGAGYAVIIDHGGGVFSHYYHGNGEIWVKKGDWVEAGQDIMFMGNTGNSSGTHLHFTLKLNGKAINPEGIVPYAIRHPY